MPVYFAESLARFGSRVNRYLIFSILIKVVFGLGIKRMEQLDSENRMVTLYVWKQELNHSNFLFG
jgi:hypothetical protein